MKNLKGLIALAFAGLMGVTLSTFAGDGECIVLANVPCEITDGWGEMMAFDSQSDLGGYYCTKYGWHDLDDWQFTVAVADNGLIAEPKTSYKFEGWYAMPADHVGNVNISYATESISSSAQIKWMTIAENAKTFEGLPFVVAKYVPLYKVTFDKKDGGGGSGFVEVAYGDKMPDIEPPSWDGYEFLGYFTKTGTEGTKYYSDMGKSEVSSYNLKSDITLYAHWQGKKFVVTFYDFGPDKDGQVTLDVTFGETPRESIKIPADSKRSFLGYWNEELDERFWDEEGTWKGGVWTVPSNVVVRAHWKANEYMVKFNENGGSGKYSDVSVAMNVPFELPDGGELAKENHVFAGWALSSDAKEAKYEGGATIRIADDKTALVDGAIIYYAFWQDMRRTVHFHADSKAILSTNELQKTAGQAYGDLPTASWPNDWYAFDGWWTTDGSRISEDTLVPVDSSTIDLYAHWTTNSYYIAFDGREPTSGEMPVQEFKFDTPAALTENAFEKMGYSFAGWATNIGAAATLSDGAVVSNLLATTKNETNTLYAVWKGHAYEVQFFGNGGLGKMSPQSFRYGAPQNLSSNQFVREGYSFAGWATDPTNEVAFADNASVTDLTTVADGKVALFAKWRSNMNVSELSVAADCDNLNLTTNKVGWTVEEYKSGEEKVGQNNQYLRTTSRSYLEAEISGPGVLTFQYKVRSFYGDSFRAYYLDDTSRQNQILGSSSLVDTWQTCVWTNTVNEHGKKLQWLFSVNGPDPADYALLDNVRWTPGVAPTNWVGVTFRLNDGTPSPADVYANGTYQVGQAIGTLPVLPDRSADLKFAGWSVSPKGGNLIDSSWIVPTFDVQLFAQWGQPQPTPDDRREITAMKVSADGLSFGFSNADSRWTYALRGTNELTATRPWPEVFSTNGATGEVKIDVPKPADEPCMFYYLEVR